MDLITFSTEYLEDLQHFSCNALIDDQFAYLIIAVKVNMKELEISQIT